MNDVVNHPDHYNQGDIECIDAIKSSLGQDGFEQYVSGNILKYVWRWKHKNGVEDLKKARWYLNKLIGEKSSDADDLVSTVSKNDVTLTIGNSYLYYSPVRREFRYAKLMRFLPDEKAVIQTYTTSDISGHMEKVVSYTELYDASQDTPPTTSKIPALLDDVVILDQNENLVAGKVIDVKFDNFRPILRVLHRNSDGEDTVMAQPLEDWTI